jgi:putative restriction endonuclease
VANAVFTTQPVPTYDDLPELRYHFPSRYLRQAEQTVGDWIVYYEPRRQGVGRAVVGGRQSYFATARVERIEPDPERSDHYYARIADYLEFTNPVPFKTGDTYYESGLRKEDGSTNSGKFGWNLRLLPAEEYRVICGLGFADPVPERVELAAEEPPEYQGARPLQFLQRPFRDAAFTRVVQKAYQNTCALTGLRLVNGGGRCEIEAAHIRSVAANGPDSPRNGLALSRTVHWMFDRGILSVGENREILTVKKLIPNQVQRILNEDGRIILPSSPAWAPHSAFIRYHRENIFKGS